jgi:cyclopropane fatty-acyl-phospholipid synthase-like methyltransferase
MFDISLYNEDFFLWHLIHARQYSLNTMDWYIDTYKPNSIVDFGCGIGSYLESGYEKGIKNLKGYDIGGEYAKKYTPNFLSEFIEYIDCTKKIECGKFDCVISFETAEHIDPEGTETFISNISNALIENGRILFTAAPPGQDGCGHINLMPKEFWINNFVKLGHSVDEEMTNNIKENWSKMNSPNYIIENLIVLK